jgi:predicted nucleic acid-binding protein
MTEKQRAVLDANVLYSAFLRDVLMSLFAAKLYEAKWTQEITAEWVEHLLENSANKDKSAVGRTQVARTVGLMQQIKPSALVKDYDHLIQQLELPDPDDRHVLAAAIASEANKIVLRSSCFDPALGRTRPRIAGSTEGSAVKAH